MLTLDLMLKLFPLFALVLAIAEYLRRINNKLDDILELNWRMLAVLAVALGRPDLNDAFEGRTGRVIRRKHV